VLWMASQPLEHSRKTYILAIILFFFLF
jgi:hypothetical protein